MSSTLNQTLIKWLTDFNFANIEGYPQFRFDLENPSDLVQESAMIKNLTDAGYDFDEKELSEKFNYTLTKKIAPPKIEIKQPEVLPGFEPIKQEQVLENQNEKE